MSFHDRLETGRRLAAKLVKYNGEDVVVGLAARGCSCLAAPIAMALDAPLDLVLVRKMGIRSNRNSRWAPWRMEELH